MKPKYERVILKISGEALAGENKFGLDEEMLGQVARQVKEIHDIGVQVAIVVGGGNFGGAGPARAWTGPPQTTWACWLR